MPATLDSWATGRTVTTGTAASSGTIPLDAANTTQEGLWANATTLYVSDHVADKVFAYNRADGSRAPTNDITLDPSNQTPQGLWSNGTTLWVADFWAHKLFAYTLDGGSRDTAKDITPAANPLYLWSDRTTVWVLDYSRNVYAYTLDGGMRDTTKDFPSGLIATNGAPGGVWSNGTTLWVSDFQDIRLYAYTLADGMRDTTNYRVLDPANTAPRGVWSDADGATWYVVDAEDRVVYVYSNRGPEAVGTLPNLTLAVEDHQIMEVAPAFRDPDGDTLQYSARASMWEIAGAGVIVNTDEVLVLGVAAGQTTVTVTATDSEGSRQNATQQFTVTVVEGPLPNQGPQAVGALPDLG